MARISTARFLASATREARRPRRISSFSVQSRIAESRLSWSRYIPAVWTSSERTALLPILEILALRKVRPD